MGTMISSSQNPKIKQVRALLGRPIERREAGAFLVEGVRLVEEALKLERSIQFLLYSADLSERGKEIIHRQKAKGVTAEEISVDLMQSLSETETSHGILAVLQLVQLPIPDSLNFMLILDQIRDPGNLGTLL